MSTLQPWGGAASLQEIAAIWERPGYKVIARYDNASGIARTAGDSRAITIIALTKATLFNSEGEPERAYEVLRDVRSQIERKDRLAKEFLYSTIYLQGLAAMRRGENENCIECRGESSCILPISPAAVHTNPTWLPPGDPALHRVSQAVSRGPGSPLAAQPGTHDLGRASR
jgi:hypothetical protein